MEPHLDASAIWESFKLTLNRYKGKHGRLSNTIITGFISPPREHTRNFSDYDWEILGRRYLEIYDSLTITDEQHNVISEPTNLSGSKFTMWLHEDSKGRVPHLHFAALRIDANGITSNDHQILQRAQRAAELLAQERGWETAREVRDGNLFDLECQCEDILKAMPTFSIDAYFDALRSLKEGYTVEAKTDNNGDYVRYVICDGNKRYPASSIGKNRKFTVKHLEDTWKKLREDELRRLQAIKDADANRMAERLQAERKQGDNKVENKPTASVQKPCNKTPTNVQQPQKPVVKHDYTKWKPGTTAFDYTDGRNTTRYYLPNDVMNFFNDEFDYRTILNWDDLINMSVGLFVEVVLGPEAQPTVGTGGGGSNNDLPRRKDDEDNMKWARRCAQHATHKIGKTKKSGLSL